jgi:hypothetical protein
VTSFCVKQLWLLARSVGRENSRQTRQTKVATTCWARGRSYPVKTVIAKNIPRVCSRGSNAFSPREDKFSGWWQKSKGRNESGGIFSHKRFVESNDVLNPVGCGFAWSFSAPISIVPELCRRPGNDMSVSRLRDLTLF